VLELEPAKAARPRPGSRATPESLEEGWRKEGVHMSARPVDRVLRGQHILPAGTVRA